MTKSFPRLLAALALLSLAAWTNVSVAQTRTWGASGGGGEIIAVDCLGCGDDIGLSISCQGTGRDAAVRVPFAALESKPAAAISPITFDLDGEVFTFDAGTEEQGLIGFVPLFYLVPNHPIMDALESARSAKISFAGRETKIGLSGSRSALTIFGAHCGWANLPPADLSVAAPSVPVADAAPQVDGPHWFTSVFFDDGAGTDSVNLVYGVPETDNVLVTASCTGARTAEMNLLVDFGGAENGNEVDAVIQVDGQEFSYAGTVFEDSSEFAGVRIEIGRRAPLWNALAASHAFRVGVAGSGLMSATSSGADTAIAAFTGACFGAKAADASPVRLGAAAIAEEGAAGAPLVQLDLGAADASPGAPLVKLNLGAAGDATAEKAPLVSLKPIAPADTVAPLVKFNLGSTTEPVIAVPSAAGVRYICDDGSSLNVAIETTGSTNTAKLAMATGETLSLAQVPSSFGEKYSDGKVTLRVSVGTIQIAEGSSRQFCTQP